MTNLSFSIHHRGLDCIGIYFLLAYGIGVSFFPFWNSLIHMNRSPALLPVAPTSFPPNLCRLPNLPSFSVFISDNMTLRKALHTDVLYLFRIPFHLRISPLLTELSRSSHSLASSRLTHVIAMPSAPLSY